MLFPAFYLTLKLFYFCIKKMKMISAGLFLQKGAFVQYKEKPRLSLACISTALPWDLLQFSYLAMAIAVQSRKRSWFSQETE